MLLLLMDVGVGVGVGRAGDDKGKEVCSTWAQTTITIRRIYVDSHGVVSFFLSGSCWSGGMKEERSRRGQLSNGLATRFSFKSSGCGGDCV